MSMRIACPRGNINGSHPLTHALTNLDAERVIYALSGAYADAVIDDENEYAHEPSYEHLPCPLEVLAWASDAEMYAEHVDSSLRQRRAA